MPHTDTTPVSASIASTGEGIRYVGNRAYAYSGAVASPNSATPDATLLEFTSQAGILICEVQFVDETTGNAIRLLQFKLNDNVVMLNKYQIVGGYAIGPQPQYSLVLPPNTKFQLNFSINGTTDNGYATLAGRVYGAE